MEPPFSPSMEAKIKAKRGIESMIRFLIKLSL